MTGMTDYTADHLLEWVTGKTAFPTLPTVYVALFTAVGTDAGTGFTEVSGGSYARAATAGSDWAAASGTAPSGITNTNAVVFPTATVGWGVVIGWGLYDDPTAGNLLAWDFLGNDAWTPFTCTSANPGVLTAIGITANSNPNLTNGAKCVVSSEYGGTLPTGLTQYTIYTVANLASDVFDFTTLTSTTGNGMVRQITQQNIPINVTPTYGAGALTILGA